MGIIQFLFLPMVPFAFHPWRIAIVSGIFFLGFLGTYFFNRKQVKFYHWSLLVCAIIWGVFAMWEVHCDAMEYNIRADLFFISPVLMSVSVYSIIINIIMPTLGFFKKQKNSGDRDV